MKTLIASVYSCHSPPPTFSTWIFTYAIVSLFIVAPEITYSIPVTDIWSYILPILSAVHACSMQILRHINANLLSIRGWVLSAPNCPILILVPRVHPTSTPRPILVQPSASRRPLSNHITHPFHPSSQNFLKIRNYEIEDHRTFWFGKLLLSH